MKFIVDDWGLSREINQAVLRLAQRDVLFGVSLLVDSDHCDYLLEELLGFSHIEIGLHLNFTTVFQGKKRFSLPFSKSKMESQYDSLLLKTQRVNYIDGHHHVHLWPGIASKAIELAQEKDIKFRVLNDSDHFGSFLLSKYFKYFLKKPEHFFYCHYLTAGNLGNKRDFRKKMVSCKISPLMIHIAENKNLTPDYVDPNDSIYKMRLEQQRQILEHLDAG